MADRIEWLGFLDDVAGLWRRVDAAVCPSREEPLGLVPIEAARFGLPTLANRVGGLQETIAPGETGWLVEPTVAGWTAMFESLPTRKALVAAGSAAHQRARQRHDPRDYAAWLTDVYDRALHHARGGRVP